LLFTARLVRLIYVSIALGGCHIDSVIADGVFNAIDHSIELVDVALEAMVLENVSLVLLNPLLYAFANLSDQLQSTFFALCLFVSFFIAIVGTSNVLGIRQMDVMLHFQLPTQ
jgi:hypothetical protein